MRAVIGCMREDVQMQENENAIAQDAKRTLCDIVARGRRRLFFTRFVDSLAVDIAAAVAISAAVGACAFLGFGVPCYAWSGVVLPFIVGAVWAASHYWRRSDIEIARQIDKANGLGDRLSSSIDFLGQAEQSAWMKVQIESTRQSIETDERRNALVSKAFGFSTPRHWRACALVSVLAIAAAASVGLASIWRPAGDVAVVGSEPEIATPNLAPAERLLLQEQIDKLAQDVEQSGDKRFEEALKELESILADDDAGKLTADEYERRLVALEKKLEDETEEVLAREEQKAIDESIRDAVKALSQMKEDPETRDVAKALEENDYDKAADILRDLLNSTDPKDKKKLEKLSRMFGDLAKNIDPTDPKLKEALKKNKDLVDDLKKKFGNDKLSKEDQKAFEEAAKKLQRAESESQNAGESGQTGEQDGQNSGKQDGQNSGEQDGQNSGERGASAASEALDKFKNALEKQAQQAGNKDDGKQGEAEQGDGAQGDGKQSEGAQKDGQSPAEDALRDLADRKKAQQNRSALQDLVDKARKDAENKGADAPQSDADAQERQKNVEDFLDRAKGKDPNQKSQDDDRKSEQQQGSEQQQQGSEQQQGSQQQQQGSEQQQGSQQQQQQGADGSDSGSGNGTANDASNAPSIDVQYRDETIKSQGGGSSGDMTTQEIIEQAGQKGFASQPYREVFQTYEKAAESVLDNETIPQGYRRYVEKYFDMIRPQ